MPFDKDRLIGFLQELERQLSRSITLVAAGGTALTLLGVKPSTIDADFTIPGEDYDEFQSALKNTPHGFKVDCWKDGTVFSQILPDDYLRKSSDIKKLKRIRLKALSPVDIVVTKIGRLDARDEQDIEACVKKFRLRRNQISRRARQVEYVGRHENYQINLRYVLDNLFKKTT
jgi:hypothetical protein